MRIKTIKPTDVKRLKKVRDFFAKIAQTLEMTAIEDDPRLNAMLNDAKAEKVFLDGYLNEKMVNLNE